MKALTHNVFSIGLGFYVLSRLGIVATYPYLALVVWLAIAVNEVIDVLGHSFMGLPVRSFVTHSIFTAPLWGASVSLLTMYAITTLLGHSGSIPSLLTATAFGIMMAYSHLFLDALTEGGIYWGRHRVALAHLRYNNPLLNASFVAIGALLVVATFY